MKQKEIISLIEAGHFNARNPDHLLTIQQLIESGSIWSMPTYWQRFARTCLSVGLVKANKKTRRLVVASTKLEQGVNIVAPVG